MSQSKKYLIKGLDFKLCQVKAMASFKKFEEIAKNKKEKQTPNKFISCLVGALGEYAAKIHIEKSMIQQRAEVISTATNKKNEFEKQDIQVNFLDEEGNKKQYKIEVKSQQKGYARCQILTYHADKYYKNGIDFVIFAEITFNELQTEAEVEIYAIERPKNFFCSNKYEIHLNKFKAKTYIRKDCVYMLDQWQKLEQSEFFKEDSEVIYMI